MYKLAKMDAVFLFLIYISSCNIVVLCNESPIFQYDMNNLVLSENTPVGEQIATLEGFDPEGSKVHYGIEGTDHLNVDHDSGVVKLIKPFDREANDSLRFIVTLEDEVEGDDQNNIVKVPISIIIDDENDNAPIFKSVPYEVSVAEDTKIGTTVFTDIKAEDVDLIGDSLEVTCKTIPEFPDACEKFEIVIWNSSEKYLEGGFVLKDSLDYNEKQSYQFFLMLTDGKFNASTKVEIRVMDVQNSPPVFQGSLTAVVQEDTPISSHVITVKAKDGDRGNPRNILYDLITNPYNYFLLDGTSGEIRTAKPLDRELLKDTNGVISLTIRAREISDGVALNDGNSSSVAVASITIKDVNDEPPTFNERDYYVSIPENLPDGSLLPNLDMIVTDTDIGNNSAFQLSLNDVSGVFTVEPEFAVESTSVIIRLSNSTLDYENPNQRKFIILVVAKETETENQLSSTATVTIDVTDANDNAPAFDESTYIATVSESAIPGTVFATLTATDRDSENFGSNSIVYELIGDGAERFNVNKKTGVLSVALCANPASCLDYETKSAYFLTYKATDNDGDGHSTSVPVKVIVSDHNDNPPIFSQDNYVATLNEGATKFEFPFFVQAHDLDKTSSITYSIPDESMREIIDIDATTGEIKIVDKRGVKRTKNSDSISFPVLAQDGQFSGTADVSIKILDVNDNKPIFLQNEYYATIPEDTPIDEEVVKVEATDDDSGVNAQIMYRIEKGAHDDFMVNSSSGILSILSKLDYDKRNYYNVTVIAIDAGTPSMTGTCTVIINVTNVNDKSPYFIPSIQRTEVRKNSNIGQIIYRMKATDSDIFDPQAMSFMFLTNTSTAIDKYGKEISTEEAMDMFKMFDINSTSGDVFVSDTLKTDIASIVNFTVLVVDTSASYPQFGQGTLIITILEVNDRRPVFDDGSSDAYYEIHLEEEQPVGTIVNRFVATDPITGPCQNYTIEPESDYFSVDKETGVIRVKNRIDYERVNSINFTLLAFDSGEPPLSASAYIVVAIDNINDERPIFDQPEYFTTIKENAPNGTSVIKVTAKDNDLDDYGVVWYKLIGDNAKNFLIDAETGIIKTANPNILDRERSSELDLRVVASDMDKDSSTAKNDVVLVHVKLQDENDNPPIFTQHPYSAMIVETIPSSPPAPILQLHAEDRDVNSQLEYRIIGGNEQDVFQLDPKTGILYPKRSLVGLERQYVLSVEVTDGSLTDVARVELNVLDVNQNKPHFKTPSSGNSTILIPEDVELNHLIMIVHAEDKDPGENGRVTYHIRMAGNNDTQRTDQFTLDENTGELRTHAILDREKQSSHQLILVARDHGTQTVYETLQFLTIILKDVNDNKPTFVGASTTGHRYVFHTEENGSPDKKIGKLMAEDADEGENAKIYFYVIKTAEDGIFVVDRQNGNLYVNGTLDREYKPSYEFYVKVTNDPNYNNYAANEILSSDDPTIVKVTVNVKDENDNAPAFKHSSYYSGVNTISNVGEFVAEVNAIDLDSGENASLQYEIGASYLFKFGSNHTSGSIVPSPFSINSHGRITTASLMVEYNQDRFQLYVIARETVPPHRETATAVNVWVYELQQLVRVILSRPPREVNNVLHEIVTELSNATGSVIVVDDIRYHVDSVGQIQHNWCDMYMHMVDNETQTIVTMPDVLKVIDDKYDFLKDYYAGFAIENVLPAYVDSNDEPFEPALVAIIALLIILCIGAITIVIVCFCFRHWIVVGEPLEMKCDMLIKKPIIDDLSTTENPLWIEQKLKLYEEQELTMQVFCEPEASRFPCSQTLERRGSDGTSIVDNTYATIQHPNRRHSSNTMLSLGPGDYATLGGSVLPVDKTTSHSQQMLEAALGFQGCTFQVPDTPPDTAELLRARSELRLNKEGQPEFVSELM